MYMNRNAQPLTPAPLSEGEESYQTQFAWANCVPPELVRRTPFE
jgi:hypothetical protein